jgi:hypothetical protein
VGHGCAKAGIRAVANRLAISPDPSIAVARIVVLFLECIEFGIISLLLTAPMRLLSILEA